MLVVVFIIAALLILTIPNITKHQSGVEDTSCDAYISMVQTQIAAYELIEGDTPTVEKLVSDGYISSNTCSNGNTISIDGDGHVKVNG